MSCLNLRQTRNRNPGLRQCVQSLASHSVGRGRTVSSYEEITEYTEKALLWMCRYGIIEKNGHVADMCVTLQTELARPTLVSTCESRVSIANFFGNCWLEQSSWRSRSKCCRKMFQLWCTLRVLLALTAPPDTYGILRWGFWCQTFSKQGVLWHTAHEIQNRCSMLIRHFTIVC